MSSLRARGQLAPAAVANYPQGELDLLPVGEDPLVEAAHGVECLPVERGGGADGARWIRSAAQDRQRLAVQVVEGEQGVVQQYPRRLDQVRVLSIAKHPSGHRDPAPRVDRRRELLDEGWIAYDVVVDHDQDVALRSCRPRVDGAREPEVALEAEPLDSEMALAGALDRAVGTAVVDDDHLVGDRLLRERVEQQAQTVARQARDDD